MITVFVPEGCAGQITSADSKKTFHPYAVNGWTLIDIPREIWMSLIRGSQGLSWMSLNPEVASYLAANPDFMMGRAFPGEARTAVLPPPPPAPIKREPVMVKLTAPEGATSFSIEGRETKIGKSGIVIVADHVADALRSHGFRPA